MAYEIEVLKLVTAMVSQGLFSDPDHVVGFINLYKNGFPTLVDAVYEEETEEA